MISLILFVITVPILNCVFLTDERSPPLFFKGKGTYSYIQWKGKFSPNIKANVFTGLSSTSPSCTLLFISIYKEL